MKLTLLSDYSLRLLMHLSANPNVLVTISETAARYDVSKNHMMKVAHKLGQHEYIETVRGRSGGLRLARTPDTIVLGHVIRHMEQSSVLVECFPGGKQSCLITNECRLKSILHEAQTAFFDCLDKYTIADLISDNAGLRGLLLEEENA